MPPWSFAVLAAVVLTALLSRIVRRGLLTRFALHADETILLDAENLSLNVRNLRASEQVVFRAFVRVTNERVLLGTGSPRRPAAALIRHVVALDGNDFGGGALDDGYVTFPARRSDVTLASTGVEIASAPGAAAFEIPRAVVIRCAPDLARVLFDAIVHREQPPVAGSYRGSP